MYINLHFDLDDRILANRFSDDLKVIYIYLSLISINGESISDIWDGLWKEEEHREESYAPAFL
jgi:hypothetical protein